MSDRKLLSEWRALTEAALEALQVSDVEALFEILERRSQLISQLHTEAAEFSGDGEALSRAEAELLAGTQRLRDVTQNELSEIRAVREKLRARDRGTLAPAITSQRV